MLQALALPEELGSAPAGFQTVPVKGGGAALKGYQYRVQVGALGGVVWMGTTVSWVGTISGMDRNVI